MPDLKPAGKPDEPVVAPAVEPVAEPKVYAGKYKSPEDLEAAYSGLEQKLGKQGEELGSLKKDKDFLSSQLEKVQTPAKEKSVDVDLDAQLLEIQNQIEDGTLSVSEGVAKTAKITGQMASESAVRTVNEQLKQSTVDGSRAAFAKDHPDFFELQKSGALDDAKGKYPGLHDDFSAYFHVTADVQAANIEAAKLESFEAGKKEMQNLESGDTRTEKVLQTPGTQAKEIGRKDGPYTKSDLQNSGLAALKKAREG